MAVKRQHLVDVFVILFGISSWIEINGLWVELPVLIGRLPESGYLASYIVVLTQLANIGPIIYTVSRRLSPGTLQDKPLIHATLLIGVVSCFLLCFIWSTTTYIGNVEHSTAFLTLAFFLAIVDCTSSVLYLPFIANLRDIYLIPYLIGEGFSGLLPSLVALMQGVGGNPQCISVSTNVTESCNVTINSNNSSLNDCSSSTIVNKTVAYYPSPRFSVESFFGVLTSMLVFSWLSFTFLNVLPRAKREWVSKHLQRSSEAATCRYACDAVDIPDVRESLENSNCVFGHNHLTKSRVQLLLLLQAFICCLTNGVLPSIQSFSCLPYGNIAYHLAVTLSSIANPLACFLSMYIWTENHLFLLLETLVSTGCAIYILVTAVQSPTPPLVGLVSGEFLIILTWIIFHGLLAYVKSSLATILRQHGGHKSLFHYGIATQAGSFVGAIVMFSVINFTSTFVFYSPCG